jgi:formate-dependent nitrite reductase membrane component NrfD
VTQAAGRPNDPGATAERRDSYHGQPVLKAPVWTWEIPVYFFTGGMGGTSGTLAWLAERRGNDVLARRAWLGAIGMLGVSPVLLISDLGRPERFLNMLRMFKLTSPMSVGSWILAGSGGCTGVSAVNAWTGWFPRLARLAKPSAAVLGLPLSTYTAALIANTAVPVWHEAHRELPFVFAAGAALSAGGAGAITTPVRNAAPARRLALAAAAAELANVELMEHRLGERHAAVYAAGDPHRYKRISQLAIGTGSAIMARWGGRSRLAAAGAGALLCAGAMATRWSIFRAGHASARDPASTVGPQRERIDRGETPGAARRTPRTGPTRRSA